MATVKNHGCLGIHVAPCCYEHSEAGTWHPAMVGSWISPAAPWDVTSFRCIYRIAAEIQWPMSLNLGSWWIVVTAIVMDPPSHARFRGWYVCNQGGKTKTTVPMEFLVILTWVTVCRSQQICWSNRTSPGNAEYKQYFKLSAGLIARKPCWRFCSWSAISIWGQMGTWLWGSADGQNVAADDDDYDDK